MRLVDQVSFNKDVFLVDLLSEDMKIALEIRAFKIKI